MSANGDGAGENRPGREVAHRLFAAEFDDSSLSYAESDEERAPNYVISPTGARLNRIFVVGTLTEVTDVNEEMVRARVVDPTGAFVVYAGQYQPEALAFLERADPPAFVAVAGKARTFEPDDGDQVYTSIRPESLATVDADTRDRWVVDTAEHTIDRIGTYAAAVDLDVETDDLSAVLQANGISDGFAEGIPLARHHYETTPTYLAGLRDVAIDAVRVVAGEQSQVEASVVSPGQTGSDAAGFSTLAASGPTLSVPSDMMTAEADSEPAAADVATSTDAAAGAAVGTATASSSEPVDEPATEQATADAATQDAAAGTDDTPDTGTDDASTVEPTAEPDADETSTSDEPVSDDTADADELGDFDVDTPEKADEADEDEPDNEAEEAGDDADEVVDDEPDEEAEEAADDEPDDADEAGEDEPGGAADDAPETDADPDEFDDGMYELDEEEREAVEEEYGTDFTTGAEVDEPGEAGIDVPSADESDAAADEPDETPADESDVADGDAASEADTDDVDLQARVVDVMDELDDGDGAERSAIVETVVDETGAEQDTVEQAIQDALMGGECFEPSEDRLQAI